MNELRDKVGAIREHPTFGVNVGRAVADRYPPFDAPAYVEQRIFEGFPSRADGSLMEAFHASPWSERQGIVSRLQDDRLRELGERLIYLESPDVLQEGIRRRYDDWRNARIHAGPDVPWTTIGSAVEELTDLATSGDSGEGSLLQDIERHLTELSNSR
jgi:exodeoxyribonuclease-1